MSDKISKISSIILTVLLCACIVFGAFFYYYTTTMEPIPEGVVLPSAKVEWQMNQLGASLPSITFFTYALLILTVIATLGFSAMGMVKNSKSTKKTLILIVGMVFVFGLSYLLGSSNIPQYYVEKFSLSKGTVKMVDAGIIASYILFFGAFAAIIAASVRSYLIKTKK